jgi:hypothetical protein
MVLFKFNVLCSSLILSLRLKFTFKIYGYGYKDIRIIVNVWLNAKLQNYIFVTFNDKVCF